MASRNPRDTSVMVALAILVLAVAVGATWTPATPAHIVAVPLVGGGLATLIGWVERMPNLVKMAWLVSGAQLLVHALVLATS